MCGIFGLSKNTVLKNDYDNVLHDVEKFVKLSEKRGSDTFGVSFKLKNLNIIYKINEKPSKAIDKIKQAAKQLISAEQMEKAKEFVAAGGDIEAIKTKYKLSAAQEKLLNDGLSEQIIQENEQLDESMKLSLQHFRNIHIFFLSHLSVDITNHTNVPYHECIRNKLEINNILEKCLPPTVSLQFRLQYLVHLRPGTKFVLPNWCLRYCNC